MKQAIQKSRRDYGIAEDLAPFRKATVRGQDHGAPLVPGIHQLEEQIAPARDDRQVADLVDDQEREPAEEADLLAQGALPFGFRQGPHEVGQRHEVDAATRLHGLDPERNREVALAGSRWAEEVQHLAALDKG